MPPWRPAVKYIHSMLSGGRCREPHCHGCRRRTQADPTPPCSPADRPHPVTEALIAGQAAQCGYCMSGVTIAAVELLRRSDDPSDAEVRARRRERDGIRRADEDVRFAADFAAAIAAQFPNCPTGRAEVIARHAATRGSGRVGRSAAGRALDPNAVRLAVAASVRHVDTSYDELLMSGVPLERISVLLGHSSVKITEKHYAPLDTRTARKQEVVN